MEQIQKKYKVAKKLIETKEQQFLCNALIVAHVMVEHKLPITAVDKARGIAARTCDRTDIMTRVFPDINSNIRFILDGHSTLGTAVHFRTWDADQLRDYRLKIISKYIN